MSVAGKLEAAISAKSLYRQSRHLFALLLLALDHSPARAAASLACCVCQLNSTSVEAKELEGER